MAFNLCAIAVLVIVGKAAVAGATLGAASSTTSPATRPTTGPTKEEEQRFQAAADRLFRPEVREHKHEPNDREKRAAGFLIMLMATENDEKGEYAAKNKQKAQEADKQLEEGIQEAWKARAKASPETRAELRIVEQLKREQAHILDFLDRPTTFPTEAASAEDLLRRMERLPQILDRMEYLGREIPYHDKRLDLLDEIDELKSSLVAKPDPQAEQKLDATQKLLVATDAQYTAQVAADSIKHSATRPTSSPTTAPVVHEIHN
jgi:hypothetical protein